MKYDCVIIGGGLSGLAAGIRLAHYNKKACICEQHSRIGGLNSYYARSGHALETGLHAMTNFAGRGAAKSQPLLKLLRQLRISYEAIQPREQNFSEIRFPGKTLRFDNSFAAFESSVAENFPGQADNFRRLDNDLMAWDEVNLSNPFLSARRRVANFISDPALTDMLFCPLMYYGSAIEDDMDYSQFAIMYKSIFKEGFFRPGGNGIRSLLDILKARFLESGGELKLKCAVKKIISRDGRAVAVQTAGGEIIESRNILSTAGAPETRQLCDARDDSFGVNPGLLAFMEVIAIPGQSAELGNASIIFFNDSPAFKFRNPPGMIDSSSGVICFPSNFKFEPGDIIPEKTVRATVMANNAAWFNLPPEDYARRKHDAISIILKKTEAITGLKNLDNDSVFIDAFTPKTVQRYTGRINGAIYGSPVKFKTGKTNLDCLYLAGADQGFLGITGAILSGISIANLYLLK
jgi:phytoene dehydrogenase-like protein